MLAENLDGVCCLLRAVVAEGWAAVFKTMMTVRFASWADSFTNDFSVAHSAV